MAQQARRRRVLCVRPYPNLQTAGFLAAIKGEWVEALSLQCDVQVIEEDFDFAETCDAIRPDFVLFEMVSWPRPQPLAIRNAKSHPEIPRAALLNGDPHEPMRPLLYNLLGECAIGTVFGFGIHHQQHMPELAHAECFSLPIFFDAAVFHDYGLEKTVPISVFGAALAPGFYPWRAQVVGDLQQIFPTLIYPHPGYRRDQASPFAVSGETYARLLNQSHFSVADTTRLDYVVRKHLEIPAAGSILVAPDSPALRDYGFVDMTNCVLGSGSALYDKIDAVARDPALRERIRLNGSQLVRSRYAREGWTGIIDWFECLQSCRAGQQPQQQRPLGEFEPVSAASRPPSIAGHEVRDNGMTKVLRQACSAILSGCGLEQAEADLQEASHWSSNIAEPFFLLGIVALLRGKAVEAAVLIARRAEELRRIDLSLARLDPVEIAWLLLVADLIGHAPLRDAMREQARHTRHLSLRRVKWLLDPEARSAADLEARLPEDCLSVHWLGQEGLGAWHDLMGRVLTANGKPALRPLHRGAEVPLPQSA